MIEGGQALSARYVLVRRLGVGGGGEVWLARDVHRDRLVALKRLFTGVAEDDAAESRKRDDAAESPTNVAIRAFERLTAAVAALEDANILRVEGLVSVSSDRWLAMEYAPGGDFCRLRGAALTDVVRNVIPVARALDRLHRAGIVHRDVKPSNVLFAEDGTPRLSDFGAALFVGERPGPFTPPGSPYNISPESLDGAAAGTAGDVYAFGAMLYELASGYPPFYPDISPERVRIEPPPRMMAKEPIPVALHELVAWCLRKAPHERPATMAVVEERLQRVLEGLSAADAAEARLEQSMSTNEPESAPRPPAPQVRPPIAPAEPLRGEWRRTAQTGPDPAALRRQGFRRGLTVSAIALGVVAVGVVFFVLPQWVESNQPQTYRQAGTVAAPQQKPAEQPQKKEPLDFAALARAKQEAEDVREPLSDRVEALRERAVEQWAPDDLKKLNDELAAGDAQFAEREYLKAVEHFNRAEPMLTALEARAGAVLAEQLQAGAAALADGRSSDAKAAFELALQLEPKNAVATRGLQRAGTLDQVLALLASAERKEQEANLAGALADFRQAQTLDKEMTRASEGVNRVSARVAGDAFASAMARGFADLGAASYGAARSAFESAGKIRPNSPEVADALKQVEQQERTRSIAAKLDDARALESREQWAAALQTYRDVVALDSTVAAANEGATRAQPRAALNQELELYLTQPERLFSSPVRAAARSTLQRAQGIANPGPVLTQQMAKLSDWLARANVPVQVALQSDNLTQVTIYRIGALGAFEQRSLELEPGEYTVLGTRPGYRDVRRQIMVVPGNAPPPIVIRCEDKI